MQDIIANIAQVRARIAAVRESCGIEKEIALMAVTKFVDPDRINCAIEQGGIRLIGENRPQELAEKYDALQLDGVDVHFIGTLQTNKVRLIIDKVTMIHSLDNLRLAAEIERRAAERGRTIDCLIEVNIGKEENKGGVLPQDVFSFYEAVRGAYPHIRVRGMMTIAPFTDDKDEQTGYFRATKQLYDKLCASYLPDDASPVLSMGMSDSFEAAIACGADIVRVGSRIFGARTQNVNKL